MSVLQRRIAELAAAEGGLADPERPFGLSADLAAAYGYGGALAELPEYVARRIWHERFVVETGLEAVQRHDATLALALLDGAVECGVTSAIRWLQVALNALGGRAGAWPELETNGRLDALTIYALHRSVVVRGDEARLVLVGLVRGQRSFELLMDAVSADAPEVRSRAWAQARAFAPARQGAHPA